LIVYITFFLYIYYNSFQLEINILLLFYTYMYFVTSQ
jgi:hypothetical protein